MAPPGGFYWQNLQRVKKRCHSLNAPLLLVSLKEYYMIHGEVMFNEMLLPSGSEQDEVLLFGSI